MDPVVIYGAYYSTWQRVERAVLQYPVTNAALGGPRGLKVERGLIL